MKQEIREKIYTVLEKTEGHKLKIKSYADMCKLLGEEKYQVLNIPYPYKDKPEMDKDECQKLYEKFIQIYKKDA